MNRKQRRAAQKSGKHTIVNSAELFQAQATKEQVLLSQAISLMQAGDHQKAEETLRRAYEMAPKHPEIVHYLGMCLFYQGRIDEALPIVGNSLNLRENDPNFLSNFGVVAYSGGNIDLAIANYFKSLELFADNPDVLTNLSAALNDKDRFSEALVTADKAIELNPDGRGAYLNRGNALKAMERVEEAITDYKKSLEIDPDYAHAYTMLGHAYDITGELELAEKNTRLAVTLAPDMYEGHNNHATVLMRLGKMAEANMHLAKSQELRPNAKTLWNMALNLLQMGDFKQGIALYEFGFGAKTRLPNRKPPMPRWQGQDLTGKSILIWREQGVGDELRFAEWYHDVIALGGRCIIEAKEKLVPLFERSFPEATVLEESFSRDVGRADADYQVPAGALPALFGLRDNSGNPYSYLKPDPFRAKAWRERMDALGDGAKIGICWRSSLRNARRNFAYADLEDLTPLFELPNTQFINLQYDDCQDLLDDFEQRTGIKIHNFPEVDQFDDLDETAAMTSALDMVVSSGTAVAQMAGALGVETWRFEARGSKPNHPPITHPWLQPNGFVWPGHWQEPWLDVMTRMAENLAER
ncbi:MAG: tetratricopeptide repeat protein, partial [Pseudomonadota bacterium]